MSAKEEMREALKRMMSDSGISEQYRSPILEIASVAYDFGEMQRRRKEVSVLTVGMVMLGDGKSYSVDKLTEHLAALTTIGCYSDTGANRHLDQTGSYAMFDEPSSVKIARTAIGEPF